MEAYGKSLRNTMFLWWFNPPAKKMHGFLSGSAKQPRKYTISRRFSRTAKKMHRFHGGRDCTGLGLRAPVCKEFFSIIIINIS